MKFFNSIGPNPKLVRMFAAEKGYEFPEVEEVDIMAGANRQGAYLEKNPAGQLPAAELPSGLVIAETIALCELIEDREPAPALIGTTPEERAETRMWTRRIEWKINQPLADAFRNSAGLPLFKDRLRTHAESAEWLSAVAQDGLAWLDAQLAGRETIVPGRFTLADVALFAFTEFGGQVGQPIGEDHKNVLAWYEATSKRPSAQA